MQRRQRTIGRVNCPRDTFLSALRDTVVHCIGLTRGEVHHGEMESTELLNDCSKDSAAGYVFR